MPDPIILSNIRPELFATAVVACMVITGLVLGSALDRVMGWFGLRIERREKS